jgi:hypothetical protein
MAVMQMLKTVLLLMVLSLPASAQVTLYFSYDDWEKLPDLGLRPN